jgi:hypothetical protein
MVYEIDAIIRIDKVPKPTRHPPLVIALPLVIHVSLKPKRPPVAVILSEAKDLSPRSTLYRYVRS